MFPNLSHIKSLLIFAVVDAIPKNDPRWAEDEHMRTDGLYAYERKIERERESVCVCVSVCLCVCVSVCLCVCE